MLIDRAVFYPLIRKDPFNRGLLQSEIDVIERVLKFGESTPSATTDAIATGLAVATVTGKPLRTAYDAFVRALVTSGALPLKNAPTGPAVPPDVPPVEGKPKDGFLDRLVKLIKGEKV